MANRMDALIEKRDGLREKLREVEEKIRDLEKAQRAREERDLMSQIRAKGLTKDQILALLAASGGGAENAQSEAGNGGEQPA